MDAAFEGSEDEAVLWDLPAVEPCAVVGLEGGEARD